LQRRWQLRGDDYDESDTALHGKSRVETAGHLQILLRDKRRVLPVRRADVFHEVWILDLRRIHGEKPRSRPGGVMCVSEISVFSLSVSRWKGNFPRGGEGHRESSHTSCTSWLIEHHSCRCCIIDMSDAVRRRGTKQLMILLFLLLLLLL